MRKRRFGVAILLVGLSAIAGIATIASLARASEGDPRGLTGTVWVANRGDHTIRGFDAGTGAVVQTVAMAASSQPGDLAFAKGNLYVAEEFAVPLARALHLQAAAPPAARAGVP